MGLTKIQSEMYAGGPAFSAYASSPTSIAANWTKIIYQVEEFDTNNNFASSRFTPTVAGYYQLSGNTGLASASLCVSAIYKNGVEYKRGSYSNSSNVSGGFVSSLVYLNGTTDYVELWTYTFGTVNSTTGINETWFNGALVRPA